MLIVILLCCVAALLILSALVLVIVATQADYAMRVAAEINDETTLLRAWYGRDDDPELGGAGNE